MRKILVMIDVQQGFLSNNNTKHLIEKVEKLLQQKLFDKVIATRFINYDNSPYERILGWTALKSKEEQSLPIELAKYVDCYIDKSTYNCVDNNFLNNLKALNDNILPESVYLLGVDTEGCVLASAIGFFEANIRPIVLEEYTASIGGKDYHNAGIKILKRLIGKVKNECMGKL